MWSNKYNYYNIKSDREHPKKIETETVMNVLLQTGNFVQKNHQTLINADHFPWADITLVETKDGNFASSTNKIVKKQYRAIKEKSSFCDPSNLNNYEKRTFDILDTLHVVFCHSLPDVVILQH